MSSSLDSEECFLALELRALFIFHVCSIVLEDLRVQLAEGLVQLCF